MLIHRTCLIIVLIALAIPTDVKAQLLFRDRTVADLHAAKSDSGKYPYAEFYLNSLADQEMTARKRTGTILTIGGVGFALGGIVLMSSAGDHNDDEWSIFADELMGAFLFAEGALLGGSGVAALMWKSKAEKKNEFIARIEDPELRAKLAHVSLYELADLGRRNRLLTAAALMTFYLPPTLKSGNPAYGPLFFAALAGYEVFIHKSTEERTLQRYEELMSSEALEP